MTFSRLDPHMTFSVGNTRYNRRFTYRWPVHPHSRGEHSLYARIGRRPSGSSPLAWGTLWRHREVIAQVRFIPTRVGNTATSFSLIIRFRVHPHSRGEHQLRRLRIQRQGGSSPLAWGTLERFSTDRHKPRFIPTRVGNTRRDRLKYLRAAVHPHSRGEH